MNAFLVTLFSLWITASTLPPNSRKTKQADNSTYLGFLNYQERATDFSPKTVYMSYTSEENPPQARALVGKEFQSDPLSIPDHEKNVNQSHQSIADSEDAIASTANNKESTSPPSTTTPQSTSPPTTTTPQSTSVSTTTSPPKTDTTHTISETKITATESTPTSITSTSTMPSAETKPPTPSHTEVTPTVTKTTPKPEPNHAPKISSSALLAIGITFTIIKELLLIS